MDPFDEPMQVENQQCEASCYGMCDDDLSKYTAVWHVRPRMKDIPRGYRPFSYVTTLQVILCSYHYKRITSQYSNADKLPDIYGWDATDAITNLMFDHLEYTGIHSVSVS